MKNDRTYGWYVLNDFRSGESKVYKDELLVHLKNFEKLGLLDQVPTFDTFVPLVEKYTEWYKGVNKDWKIYKKEEQSEGLMYTLHWTLHTIVSDPTVDAKILRHVGERFPMFTIWIVKNSSCPDDLLTSLIQGSGKKGDPTSKTNGGEIACFALFNEDLSSKLVHLCALKAKRASTQKDVVYHKNVSKETLVYLAKECKSESVKKLALRTLQEKGWLSL